MFLLLRGEIYIHERFYRGNLCPRVSAQCKERKQETSHRINVEKYKTLNETKEIKLETELERKSFFSFMSQRVSRFFLSVKLVVT